MTTPIVQTRGLTRTFGRHPAVNGLDLVIPTGSIFALMGPNGAGKTTTLKMLMNIIEPSAGSAEVLGVDSRRLGPEQFQQIGHVSENQELPDGMTVRAFLAYCRALYPNWDDALAARLRDQFQLPADRPLRHLSRGMRMKAALLSSLAYRPRLLVLDEPFSGLDAAARDEFTDGMLTLAGETNWTIVISSHDISEVERLVDWFAFLDAGRLRLAEPVDTLRARFRQVEVTFDAEPPPSPPPATWFRVERASRVLRFVDSAFDEERGEAAIRAALPGSRSVHARPMDLREIFVALARNPAP